MNEKSLVFENRDATADIFYEEESFARNELFSKRMSLEAYLVRLDKIQALGKSAENGNKEDITSLENAFTYYSHAYERLCEVASSLSDESIDQRLQELKGKLEHLIAKARDIGNSDLADKLRDRLSRIQAGNPT